VDRHRRRQAWPRARNHAAQPRYEPPGGHATSPVLTKTLDRSSGYGPYEATRAFWERNGFIQVNTIDPLPGWQPGNPAAIYVAAIRPTR
jgi:hypothetical protein